MSIHRQKIVLQLKNPVFKLEPSLVKHLIWGKQQKQHMKQMRHLYRER